MNKIEEQTLKIVELRIAKDQIKLENEKLKKLVEMWKFSNSHLCEKIEKLQDQYSQTKTQLIKLRNC